MNSGRIFSVGSAGAELLLILFKIEFKVFLAVQQTSTLHTNHINPNIRWPPLFQESFLGEKKNIYIF